MAIELRWLASLSASALHAAQAIVHERSLVDDTLQQELSEPAVKLVDELDQLGLDPLPLVDLMAALAIGIENNRELVEVAITKVRGRTDSMGEMARALAGRVADLEAAFRRVLPDAVDQLALRGEPLKQLWEARGPGLLAHVGRLTEENLIAREADVALVYPVLGGHGVACLPFNSVRIEAVLANKYERLPEVVRLAWLLAQLQLDLPVHSEQIHRDRLPRLAQLAILPAVMEAAQHVEFALPESRPLATALSAWHVVSDQVEANATAEIVESWWKTYQEQSVPIRIALGSLDRMLSETSVADVN